MKVLEKKINSITSLHSANDIMEDITDIKTSINDAVSILNDLLNSDKVSKLFYYWLADIIDKRLLL